MGQGRVFPSVFAGRVLRLMVVALVAVPLLAACGGGVGSSGVKRGAFTSSEFGVAVSPRVTKAKFPPRGGGRQLGTRAYVVRGVTYQPVAGPGYVATGRASWYGQDFHGRRTANGEIFGAYYLTAASPVLPIPSYARVTNLENGRSVLVRINDRGPYLHGRIIDVSYEAATTLGFVSKGSANVEVRYVGPAPLNGDDSRMLKASINKLTNYEREQETRLAMVEEPSVPEALEAVENREGRVNLADYQQSRGSYSSRDLVGDFMGLFGYAESAQASGAAAATEALAAGALQDWVIEENRELRLELGTFDDFETAVRVAQGFAALGAVEEEYLESGTRLTVTYLKPGVGREDLLLLAQELGLTGLILY